MDVHPTKNVSIGIDPYPNEQVCSVGWGDANQVCVLPWKKVYETRPGHCHWHKVLPSVNTLPGSPPCWHGTDLQKVPFQQRTSSSKVIPKPVFEDFTRVSPKKMVEGGS